MTPDPTLTDQVFVYGTLRPGQRNHHLVAPFVVRSGPARLLDHALWTCDAYPGARPTAGAVIDGDLLTLLRPAEALAVLDALEEVPTLYTRVRVPLLLRSAEPTDAWTYVLALTDLRDWRPLDRASWSSPA